MIVVHHLENSRSQRILWLLEELGMDYEVRRYDRDPQTMRAPRELASVHPLGKAPVIEDTGSASGAAAGSGPGATGGRVIAETGAIVEYLIDAAEGRLGPPANREAVLRYRQFLHYAEGSLMPPLFGLLVTTRLGLLGRPARGQILAMIGQHLDWLESELGDRAWFAGDEFSAADIMMSFPLEISRSRAGLGDDRPNLIDWLERIHARPAFAAALQKGGPYAYA
ncbi:glutathione S-transferase family protein [Sphingosinicella sp. CPCC 101087]|uniref:glutathione S-transferase family protein n=1 Tax=Sphingosinicella sp. CPCC 101087 TaxID=2497754 RepID=UPI00101DC6F9|nr:glutathione S-transferase [Sphingosinicella sp. CPCC 101087]